VKRERMLTNACKALAKQASSHVLLTYILEDYLFPLITNLIDNMGGKKIFTKMDLRWEFNNVRIKKRDE